MFGAVDGNAAETEGRIARGEGKTQPAYAGTPASRVFLARLAEPLGNAGGELLN